MHGLHVLQRVQGRVDLCLRQTARERLQDEDPRDPWVGVELAEGGDHLGELHAGAQLLAHVAVLELLRQPANVLFVGPGPEVVSEDDGGEPRLHRRQAQDLELVLDARVQFLGQRVAVDDPHPTRASSRSTRTARYGQATPAPHRR